MGSNRPRTLNRRMDDLFPVPSRCVFTCWDCEWTTAIRWDPLAVLLYDECPDCGSGFGRENVRREDTGLCRLCGLETSGRRTRWCSERCKRIAAAVQGMFTWSTVRKRVLSRDDHTCQACGAGGDPDGDVTLDVDHIHELQDGGHPFDERNLITLCERCHGEKTNGSGAVTSEDAPGLAPGDYLETD